jgi:DNA-binding CsgD family transcriptional regulator
VSYLTRALAEPPPVERRADVLTSLGSAENLLFATRSEEHLREALELSEDPIARGTAALPLAGTLLMNGRAEEAVALARRTAVELPPEADVLLAALEALRLTAAIFGVSEPDASERTARHRRLPLAPGTGPKVLAGIAAHQWAYGGGSADECVPLALAALDGGDLIAGGHLLPSVAATMIVALADRAEAARAWEALLAQAHASGSLGFKSAVSLCRGSTLLRYGELADAEASLRDGIEELTLAGATNGRVEVAAWLAAVERERGNLAAARRELEAVSDPGDASQAARYWLDSHAEQLLAEERFEEALGVARDAAKRFAAMHAIDTPARAHEAIALHHLGQREQALTLAAEEVETARRWGAPAITARALRILGTVERSDGIVHLREAAGFAARSPARLELAKALAAQGAVLPADRRPAEARDPLRRALELAGVLGAGALAAQVRQELHAAGGRPRTTALQGPGSLTPSERRVAERAAAGQTNRAIAEALFVTPKTVELHLRNAYGKLGARNRHDLPALLATPSTAPSP